MGAGEVVPNGTRKSSNRLSISEWLVTRPELGSGGSGHERKRPARIAISQRLASLGGQVLTGHVVEKPVEQERIEKDRQLAKGSSVPSQGTSDTAEDQLDQAWENERKRREREFSRALVEEWLRNDRVLGHAQETERIKSLKAAVDEWTAKCPQGFEHRQAKKREEERAKTKAALVAWLQRHKARWTLWSCNSGSSGNRTLFS
jgi:hypothetical protein